MNQLANFKLSTTNGVATMSSLEMVDYINASREHGKPVLQHKDFLEKVPTVLKKAAAGFSATALYLVNGATRQRPVYNFPKREACLMAMSYSYELQAQIFDAWQAAEAALVPVYVIPATYSSALRLAADLDEKLQATVVQLAVTTTALEVATPKAEFHDAVVADDKVYALGDAAKLLGIGRTAFCNFLRAGGYTQHNLVPYASAKSWLESAFSQYTTDAGRVCPPTTYVTGRGLAFFQRKLATVKVPTEIVLNIPGLQPFAKKVVAGIQKAA